MGKNITVGELVGWYLCTKTGVKPNTLANYNFVQNLLKKETFSEKKISQIKTSDAKLFLNKAAAGRERLQHHQNSPG